jgi:hypothetical protein
MDLLTLVIPMSTLTLAGGTVGCTVTTEPPVVVAPAPTGTLTVRWSIAGAVHPALCNAYRATDLEVVVYDEAGAQVASTTFPCEGFSLTLPLPDGTYTADVTLVDPNGTARSTTKPLQAIVIVRGTDLAIDLDFPQSSIL